MRSTRLHHRGSQLRPHHVTVPVNDALPCRSNARPTSNAPEEGISGKVRGFANGSTCRDASGTSVEKQKERGRRPIPRQIHQASKEKMSLRITGKLRPLGASSHKSKRITRSMNISLDDPKTVALLHDGCRKRKTGSKLSCAQPKRHQQHQCEGRKGVSGKENNKSFHSGSDGAEYNQSSSANSHVKRRLKETNVTLDKEEVLLSLEGKRKTRMLTRWSQAMAENHLVTQRNEHPKSPGLTEIRPNEEKYGSPVSVPEEEAEVEQVTLRNKNTQAVDAKISVHGDKHKNIKKGQGQELLIDCAKQSCRYKHEVNRLTEEYKQNDTKEATGMVEMVQRQTRVMKQKMKIIEREKCRKEQDSGNIKEANEEFGKSKYRTSLEQTTVERRRLRSMDNVDNIKAAEKDKVMKVSPFSKDKFSRRRDIKDGCNVDTTMDDDKGITDAGDGATKNTDFQPEEDESRMIIKTQKRKLKKTSLSRKVLNDSSFEVRLQLEPGANYFKDTEQWLDKTESVEGQSKFPSAGALCHEQKAAADHSSGSMGNEAQGIVDKDVVVVGDGFSNASKKLHLDVNFLPGEQERHMHGGQCAQLKCNAQEDPMFETPNFLSNALQEDNIHLGDGTDKQNNIQAVLGEDQVSNRFTVDDNDNHFVGFKRKRMTRALNDLTSHFDSSIGHDKDDHGKSDGILKVDSGRMHFWVAANPKETGGRQMRPRLLYADQPLQILLEGRDQDYYSYDGGVLHQNLVEQEADLKSFEKAAFAQAAGGNKKDFQIQAIKRENILIPSFQVLPESDGHKTDMESEYILPKLYIKHTESILDEHEAEYDMDEDDEGWLRYTNKIRLHSDLPPLSDSQFEKIIEMLELRYAQLIDQENACDISFPEIRQGTQIDCKSDELYESRSPDGMAMLAKVQQCSEDCCICNGGENSSFNPVFTCSNCHIIVHQSCYGIAETQSSDDELRNNWICRKCEAVMEGKLEPNICCSLCYKKGGALKPSVKPSKWVHVVCALYTDETYFVDTDAMEPVDGLDAAEARAQRQKHRCCLCGMRGGCLERCCARGCNAKFHVSCGVNQGASFQLRHSNQQVVGVRSFCSKHANVAPVATTVKDVVLGSKKERGDHVREKRKHLSLKNKQRDLSRLSSGENERITLEQHYEFATKSELDGHSNQHTTARQDGTSNVVEKLIQSRFQELCAMQGETQISWGQEKDPASILTLEDALQINTVPSHDLQEVYWYWISKRTRLGGFLLHKLQQEQAAKKYCIFNKDEVDDLSDLHMEDISRHDAFNLEAKEQQRLAFTKVHLEKLQDLLRLVIHREKLKFQIYSVEQDIITVKLNVLKHEKYCTWCRGSRNLKTCTVCFGSFCYKCCKHRKGCGVKHWAIACKFDNFICSDCRLEKDKHAKHCKIMKNEAYEGFTPGVETMQIKAKCKSASCYDGLNKSMPLTGIGDVDVLNMVQEEVLSDGCMRQVKLNCLLTEKQSKVDCCSERSHELKGASSTDVSRKSTALHRSLMNHHCTEGSSKAMEGGVKHQNQHVKTVLLSELLNSSCTYSNGKVV